MTLSIDVTLSRCSSVHLVNVLFSLLTTSYGPLFFKHICLELSVLISCNFWRCFISSYSTNQVRFGHDFGRNISDWRSLWLPNEVTKNYTADNFPKSLMTRLYRHEYDLITVANEFTDWWRNMAWNFCFLAWYTNLCLFSNIFVNFWLNENLLYYCDCSSLVWMIEAIKNIENLSFWIYRNEESGRFGTSFGISQKISKFDAGKHLFLAAVMHCLF